jgi:LemA protein
MVVVENYPDLKASSNFRALQDQLEGTENRIAVARMRYNGAVRRYNTYIRMVPGNVVAWIFGFSVKEYFEAEEDAESPVEIRF